VKLFLLCLLIWVSLFAAACAAVANVVEDSECDRLYHVQPGFTRAQRLAIERAVNTWNDVAALHICLDDAPAEVDFVMLVEPGSEKYQALAKGLGTEFYGLINRDGIYLVGYRDAFLLHMSNELFESVALHEFGHALGLGHTPAPSVMHAHAGTAYSLTPIDMAECKRVGACR
jgi:predicted Zn-dependent protease